ncbi:MAG: sulfotransferase [Planctomycetota bacterium]
MPVPLWPCESERETVTIHQATANDSGSSRRASECEIRPILKEHEGRAQLIPGESDHPARENSRSVKTAFLIGPPRCGTTLLGYLLGGGPRVMSLSEPFLAYAIYGPRRLRRFFFRLERTEGLKRLAPPNKADPGAFLGFLEELATANDLSHLVIKETYRQDQAWENVRVLDWIATGPNRVAGITRHPYDAAVSTLKFCRWWRGVAGHVLRLGAPGLPLFRDDAHLMEYFADNWSGFVHWCQSHGLSMTRYEDLVSEPERELRRVCEACSLPFDATMLDHEHPRAAFGGIGAPEVVKRRPRPVNTASVGRKDQLAEPLREIIRSRCAEAAKTLGYPL